LQRVEAFPQGGHGCMAVRLTGFVGPQRCEGAIDSVLVLNRESERHLWLSKAKPHLVVHWDKTPMLEGEIRYQQTDARLLSIVEQIAVFRKSEASLFRLHYCSARREQAR